MRAGKIGLLGIASISLTCAGASTDSTVVLGGSGPSPYFEGAVDKIADALTSAGVKIKILSGGPTAKTALLDEMKQPGYSNLLYVTLESPRDDPSNSSRGGIVGDCFVGGVKVWEEKAKGPLVLPLSTDHEVANMINGIVKKIGKRAGGPCLPKS
jgi:hypothetical protein